MTDIPRGYRVLNPSESMRVGDLWLDGDEWHEVGEAELGRMACSMLATVIRKKVTT
jgi:hypothetical protein